MTIYPPRTTYSFVSLVLTIAIVPYDKTVTDFSDWGTPTNLGCVVNSAAGEQGPALSKDGLSLYFGSNRPGGFGATDIWVSQRTSDDDPWGPPVNLGSLINTSGVENVPALSRDGHLLFFNSDRPGTSGIGDIWVSFRNHIHDDFAWQPPVNLGPGVNSALLDAGAGYLANEEAGLPLLFFGRGTTPADTDIYVSQLQPDGLFGDAALVPELSSANSDQRPSVRFDGHELFLGSDRLGTLGLSDVWVSIRQTVFDVWRPPTNLGTPVNSAFGEMQPNISANRLTLFFVSNRPGGCVAFDIYMTTREKTKR